MEESSESIVQEVPKNPRRRGTAVAIEAAASVTGENSDQGEKPLAESKSEEQRQPPKNPATPRPDGQAARRRRPEQVKLPEEIEKFIPVFLALDEKTKEAFLSRVNTLTLSYRIRIGADNSYRVVTPEATPVARRLSELLARVLTAAQRMGTLVKEEKVMLTPRLVRVIKDTNDLWADDGVRIPSVVYGPLEAALNRQIDIFRAVEIEARYHKTPPRYRKDNFKDFKAIELTDDLDALLEHVRANRNRGTGETHQAQNAGQSVDAPDAESGADPATD